MLSFVFRWILWFVSAVGTTVFARYFLHSWAAFENQFIVALLGYIVTYPCADNCSSLKDGKPLKVVELKARPDDASVDKDLFEPIRNDPNLFIAGFTAYLVKALGGIYGAKHIFFIDSMDAIIVNSHKTDVLLVKFPAAGYNRCIHLDILTFRRWYWIADSVLTMALLVASLLIVGTESIFGTIHGALKIIFKL